MLVENAKSDFAFDFKNDFTLVFGNLTVGLRHVLSNLRISVFNLKFADPDRSGVQFLIIWRYSPPMPSNRLCLVDWPFGGVAI